MKLKCAGCGAEIELPDRPGFRDTCPSCDAWLHACVNCRLQVGGQCTEPSAEKVRDPEGMNFCDWFVARTQEAGKDAREGQGRDAAEELWRKLTKK